MDATVQKILTDTSKGMLVGGLPGAVVGAGIGIVGSGALAQGQAVATRYATAKDHKTHLGGGLAYNILHKYKWLGGAARLEDQYDAKNEAVAKSEYGNAVAGYQGLTKYPLFDVWGGLCLGGSEIMDAGSNLASLIGFAAELLAVGLVALAPATLGVTLPLAAGVEEAGKTVGLVSDGLGLEAEMAKMEYLNYRAAKAGSKASPEKDEIIAQMAETNTDTLGTIVNSIVDVFSIIGIPKTLNFGKLKKSATVVGRMPAWIRKAENFAARASGPLLKFAGRMKPWLLTTKKLLTGAYKIEKWIAKVLDAYGDAKKFLKNTRDLAEQVSHGAGIAYRGAKGLGGSAIASVKEHGSQALNFLKGQFGQAKSLGLSAEKYAGGKIHRAEHWIGDKARSAVQWMLPHFGGDGTRPLMASSLPSSDTGRPMTVRDGGMTGPFYPAQWTGRQYKNAEQALNDSANVAVYVNGVQTPLARHTLAAQELAQQIGKPVVGIYNAAGSVLQDLGQSATDKFGILGMGRRNAAINTLARVIGQHGSPAAKNGGLDLYAHSQGGIIVSEAIRQAKGTGHDVSGLDVTTFGGAAWSRPEGLRGYHNYAYDSDVVPTLGGSTSVIGSLLRTPFNRSNPLNPFMGRQGMTSTADDTFTLHHRGAGGRPHGVISDPLLDASGKPVLDKKGRPVLDSEASYIKSLPRFRAKEAAVRARLNSLGPVGGPLASEALNSAMVTRSLGATGFAFAKSIGAGIAGLAERGHGAASGMVRRGYSGAADLVQTGYGETSRRIQQGYTGAKKSAAGAYSEGAGGVAAGYGRLDGWMRHLPSLPGMRPNTIWGALDRTFRGGGGELDHGLRVGGTVLDHGLRGLGRTTDTHLRGRAAAYDSAARSGGGLLDRGLRRMGTGVSKAGRRGAAAMDDYYDAINALQRSGHGDHPDVNPAALRADLRKQNSGFLPDGNIRARLGGHLGFDPGGARLHTGPAAASASRRLNAEAFTIGNDVFFGEGRFDPHTPKGLGLIAHELTHVGQQTGTTGTKARFFSEAGGDQMEREAQHTAEHVLANAGSRGGLFVEDYIREYEGESGLTQADQQRLDRISVMALTEAQRMVASQGMHGSINADVLDVQVEIDLGEMSDGVAARVWAEALISAILRGSSQSSAFHTDASAIQRSQAGEKGHGGAEVEGLRLAGFEGDMTHGEVGAIYRGNWQRDMSQVPKGLAELLSVGEFGGGTKGLGGYLPSEHLDNPIGGGSVEDPTASPEDLKKSWNGLTPEQRREAVIHSDPDVAKRAEKSGVPDYVEVGKDHAKKRLITALKAGRKNGMLAMGDALHAIEDYYAHSNFVEVAYSLLAKNKSNSEGRLAGRLLEQAKNASLGFDAASAGGMEKGRQRIITGNYAGVANKIVSGLELVEAQANTGEITTAITKGLTREGGSLGQSSGETVGRGIGKYGVGALAAIGGGISGGVMGAWHGLVRGWHEGHNLPGILGHMGSDLVTDAAHDGVTGGLTGWNQGSRIGGDVVGKAGQVGGKILGTAVGAGLGVGAGYVVQKLFNQVDALNKATQVVGGAVGSAYGLKSGVKSGAARGLRRGWREGHGPLNTLGYMSKDLVTDAAHGGAMGAKRGLDYGSTGLTGLATLASQQPGTVSHSQLAKDGTDHPMFNACRALQIEVDYQIGSAMREAWATGDNKDAEAKIEGLVDKYVQHPKNDFWWQGILTSVVQGRKPNYKETSPATGESDKATLQRQPVLGVPGDAGVQEQAARYTQSAVAEGVAGTAYGTVQSLAPGGFLAPSLAPHSRTFEFFRGAGQIATGIVEMMVGGGGEVGGGALDATGVGAVAGVPLNVASALVMATGASSTMAGFQTLAHAMAMNGDGDFEDYHDPKWGKRGGGQGGSGSGGGPKGGGPKGKKGDIKEIEDVAKDFKMSEKQRRDFGKFIENEKAAGRRGTKNDRGDFKYPDLREKAREFLEK